MQEFQNHGGMSQPLLELAFPEASKHSESAFTHILSLSHSCSLAHSSSCEWWTGWTPFDL